MSKSKSEEIFCSEHSMGTNGKLLLQAKKTPRKCILKYSQTYKWNK